MSPLYELKIGILSSSKYRHVVWLLTGCACISMYVAELPCFIRLVLLIGMLWTLYQLAVCPRPHPRLQAITYQHKKWALEFIDRHLVYDNLSIALDTGLFLLLYFYQSQSTSKQWIVMFYDQLSPSELRQLNIIHTIVPEKTTT